LSFVCIEEQEHRASVSAHSRRRVAVLALAGICNVLQAGTAINLLSSTVEADARANSQPDSPSQQAGYCGDFGTAGLTTIK
jgi:hypothetical protein